MFSNFYRLDIIFKTLWFISKSRMIHQQNSDWKTDFSWCSYGSPKCMFVLPIVFIIQCEIVNKIRWCALFSFKHVSLWCLFFDPDLITLQSFSRGPIKNSNRITPTHLSLCSLSWCWLCANGAAGETEAGGSRREKDLISTSNWALIMLGAWSWANLRYVGAIRFVSTYQIYTTRVELYYQIRIEGSTKIRSPLI